MVCKIIMPRFKSGRRLLKPAFPLGKSAFFITLLSFCSEYPASNLHAVCRLPGSSVPAVDTQRRPLDRWPEFEPCTPECPAMLTVGFYYFSKNFWILLSRMFERNYSEVPRELLLAHKHLRDIFLSSIENINKSIHSEGISEVIIIFFGTITFTAIKKCPVIIRRNGLKTVHWSVVVLYRFSDSLQVAARNLWQLKNCKTPGGILSIFLNVLCHRPGWADSTSEDA